MEPREISPGIWVFTSALYQTTSTVIKTAQEIFVVDPNWLPQEVMRIRAFVDCIKGPRKLYLLFTHSDYDHIVGYGAFVPDAVIASQAFVHNPDKDRDVGQAVDFDLKHYLQRDYPMMYPHVDIVIKDDGQVLEFDDTILTFYLAPGHTDQGIFMIYEPQGIWVAGDYLSDIEFPLVQGSLVEYRRTLDKVGHILQRHTIRFLIPGHGGVEDSVDGISQRRDDAVQYLDDIEAFIAHRIPFPEMRYRERYPFWNGIRDWHDQNLTHVLLV